MEYLVLYFFIYLFEALILWQYTSNLFFSRYTKRKEGIVLLCLYAGLFFVSFMQHIWLNVVTFCLFNFIFIFCMYQSKWYSALFHSLISTAIMTLSELITSNILFSARTDFSFLLMLSIFSKLIYFLSLYSLSHIFRIKNRSYRPSTKASIFLAIVPLTSVFVVLILFYICENTQRSARFDFLVSFTSILMLAINILVFSINNYNEKKNAEFLEMQQLLQKEYDSAEYYKMLLQQSENQSILIHDIKKHLQSIALLNEQHNSEKISAYIDRLIHSSDLQEAKRMCDHDMLNAILCRYQRQCREKHIQFRPDIRSGTVHFLKDNDLTSLFCNLLDNAIEAACKMPDSFIELSVSKEENTPLTVLTLKNSCRINPFAENGKDLPTTKPDKQRHGYGIKSIGRIVKKYCGHMQMYYDSETTTFHTIIVLKS